MCWLNGFWPKDVEHIHRIVDSLHQHRHFVLGFHLGRHHVDKVRFHLGKWTLIIAHRNKLRRPLGLYSQNFIFCASYTESIVFWIWSQMLWLIRQHVIILSKNRGCCDLTDFTWEMVKSPMRRIIGGDSFWSKIS